MNPTPLIDSLERFGHVLPIMLNGVSQEDATWRPPSGNWTLLEIVCHLVDEEKEDFGLRLRLTLEDPTQTWPAWDPEGCAVSRNYNQRNFSEMIREFSSTRAQSVAWLRGLTEVDWNLAYEHPTFGHFAAGRMLASWSAHDQLHVRQIGKRMYELIRRDATPFEIDYAGALS